MKMFYKRKEVNVKINYYYKLCKFMERVAKQLLQNKVLNLRNYEG
jgi:hypothetical protein